MSSRRANFCTAIMAGAVLVGCVTMHAQDMEPRAYSNSPTGLTFAIGSYTYSKGGILADPALPIDSASIESHTAVFALATTLNVLGRVCKWWNATSGRVLPAFRRGRDSAWKDGGLTPGHRSQRARRSRSTIALRIYKHALGKSAKLDMIVPYTSLGATGEVAGIARERFVTDFADPFFRFSMNFIGAPALTMEEFKSYKQDWIVGASLRVGVPLGHYDEDKLLNVGSNRWSFRPEIGVSKAFGRWTVELAPGMSFFTDNGDFLSGRTREQAPLFGLQASLSYVVMPSLWLSVSGSYFVGGRSTVDDVENNDEQEGGRISATLAMPVNRYNSIKVYALRGFNSHRETDLDVIGIAWQYRWGGGF